MPKALRRRRPCEIIRRDLEGHITLFTFLAEAVNQHNRTSGLYVEYSLVMDIDLGHVLDYKGIFRGLRAEQILVGPGLGTEDIEQYLERRRRESAEERMLDAQEGL